MNTFLNLLQLRAIENEAAQNEITLIERAGVAVAQWVAARHDLATRVLVIAGRGNNGSDGLAAAIKLINLGYKVDVVRLFKDNTEINQRWAERLLILKRPLSKLPLDLNKYGLIIDAIYGIGLTHELDVDTAKVVQKVNSSYSCVLSLDAPSGLNPFSGRVLGEAIMADHTLTFIADKPGLHTGDGLDYSGEVEIVDLIDYTGYTLPESNLNIEFNLLSDIKYRQLTRLKFNTNKGTYGTVAIIGGNSGMHGALCLAGRAALLSGAGKVVLGYMDNNFRLSMLTPELISQPAKDVVKNMQAFDAIAIGPGLGQDTKSIKILSKLLDAIEDSKLLVDADALNLISSNRELKLKFREVRYKVVTPHPGEAARILGVTVNEIQDNRFMSVSDLTDKLNSITLLKGAGSLIMAGKNVYINTTGNPALANAGQGDTLTGLITGFLGQGLELIDATRLGVFIHGLAASRLSLARKGYNGVLASEVADEACKIINELLYSEIF